MIAFPPRDTIRLEIPARGHRCNDGRSTLVEAASPEGSGVLVRLRSSSSASSDSFRIAIPEDTAAVPAATVAIRYFIRDAPRGFVIDSGSIHIERVGDKITGFIEGSGLETAIRVHTRIEFRNVQISTDTVPCNYAP
ncbi:MAG: hypothetical protein ABR537_10875 [Gemmatimonadales bacterium]